MELGAENAVRVGRAGRGRSRRALVAVVELVGGAANASAEALRSLNAALTPERVAVAGLRASVYVGLRDGNVRFFTTPRALNVRSLDQIADHQDLIRDGMKSILISIAEQIAVDLERVVNKQPRL